MACAPRCLHDCWWLSSPCGLSLDTDQQLTRAYRAYLTPTGRVSDFRHGGCPEAVPALFTERLPASPGAGTPLPSKPALSLLRPDLRYDTVTAVRVMHKPMLVRLPPPGPARAGNSLPAALPKHGAAPGRLSGEWTERAPAVPASSH